MAITRSVVSVYTNTVVFSKLQRSGHSKPTSYLPPPRSLAVVGLLWSVCSVSSIITNILLLNSTADQVTWDSPSRYRRNTGTNPRSVVARKIPEGLCSSAWCSIHSPICLPSTGFSVSVPQRRSVCQSATRRMRFYLSYVRYVYFFVVATFTSVYHVKFIII